jgi:hypothetical protein
MQHPSMRQTLALVALTLAATLSAQYGTFDKKAVATAKNTTTVVLQDAGGTPFNNGLMNAVKANWKFTGSTDFATITDFP